ncbi:sensor histidine kinase [Nocardia sp. NPDC058640]|uniref:sensor histidine kinase n=1 Tax=Nocardia sp. NPDC058640 TaxID=3346571 RepID=UPI00364FC80D
MPEVSRPLVGPWLATPRPARALLIGATCATGVLAPTRATFAGSEQVGPTVVWWALATGIVAVHLHHALSTVGPSHTFTDDVPDPAFGDRRPSRWRSSFALLTALVYLPMIWAPTSWGISQVFCIASAAVLFSGVLRGLLVTAPIAATAVGTGLDTGHLIPVVEVVVVFSALSGCLVGVTHLVRTVHQLDRTRTALAQRAADRERLRVSRDLHDLLGQSLSAVSLKGDLAAALLPGDPDAAQSEIHGIGELARVTLQAMRRVTHGEHTIALHAEVLGAVELLSAAGIEIDHDPDLPPLPPEIDNVFAWATREGVTNVLRHSRARTCSIVAARRDGAFFLEIVNDGAQRGKGTGNGLSGLAARAWALSGTVTARRSEDGRFHLLVVIPGGTP